MRIVTILILHALLWVCAIFLIDTFWGDAASKWVAILFTLANGLLMTVLVLQSINKEKQN